MKTEASFLNAHHAAADSMDSISQSFLTGGIYLGIFVVAGWLFFIFCVRCDCSKTKNSSALKV